MRNVCRDQTRYRFGRRRKFVRVLVTRKFLMRARVAARETNEKALNALNALQAVIRVAYVAPGYSSGQRSIEKKNPSLGYTQFRMPTSALEKDPNAPEPHQWRSKLRASGSPRTTTVTIARPSGASTTHLPSVGLARPSLLSEVRTTEPLRRSTLPSQPPTASPQEGVHRYKPLFRYLTEVHGSRVSPTITSSSASPAVQMDSVDSSNTPSDEPELTASDSMADTPTEQIPSTEW